MKRVLCWLCLVIALALWPQTALARDFYLSYNVGDDWKWNAVQFTYVDNQIWKAELPAGNGWYGKYFLKISAVQINGDSKGNIYHDGGSGDKDISSANSESSKIKLFKYDDNAGALALSGMLNKALTIYVKEDGNDCQMWYEVKREPAPSALYLTYNTGSEWKFGQNTVTKNGNYFTGSFTVSGSGDGYATFTTNQINGWSNYGKRFGPSSEFYPTMGETNDFGENNLCWKFGKGTFYYLIDYSAGIPTITFANKPLTPGEYVGEIYNLPLTPDDFKDGKKHYFLVGSRMGDWRLQPEWELQPQTDGSYTIAEPRVLYTGIIGIGVVDNYPDYAKSNYKLYAHSNYQVKMDPSTSNDKWTKVDNLAFVQNFSFYSGTNLNAKPNRSSVVEFLSGQDKYYNANNNEITIDGKTYNQAATEGSRGVLVSKIKLTFNGDAPKDLEFETDNSLNRADYITFSLVGDKIYNQEMDNYNATTHNRHLSQNGGTAITGWQEGWVQFNPETGEAYRDANGMLLYQTCFQPNWLEKHPSRFNVKLSGNKDFPYSSRNIVMRNASRFTAEELKDDPYAPLYKRFNGGSGQLGNNNAVKIYNEKGELVFDYKEANLENYDAPHNNNNSRTANWQCFVVKDMWISGEFKVWSGWGGGTKKNEFIGDSSELYGINGDASSVNVARWYYVNGGHGTSKTKKPITASDLLSKNASVQLYGTSQDRDGANFELSNLTYFKRVIVWYDPSDVLEHGFDNSVIQLIVEKLGPNIKAFPGAKGHQIDYSWNIPDLDLDQEKSWKVTEYTIKLFRYNEDGSVSLVKSTTEKPENATVGTFITEHNGTDSDLTGGTYYYTIDLTYLENNNTETPVTRSARSNEVIRYDAAQPMTAVASQRTEMEGERTLYSFDLDLDIKLKNGTVTAGNNAVYSYADLAKGYLIHVDEANANKANSALAFKVITKDGETKTLTGRFEKRASQEVYSYNPDQQATSKITVSNGYWLTLDFDTYTSDFTLRMENLVLGDNTGDKDFKFTVYLDPKDNLDVDYATFKLAQAAPTATMYVPQLGIAWTEAGVRKVYPYHAEDCGADNPETGDSQVIEALLCNQTTHQKEMPLGTHFLNDDTNSVEPFAPVHYHELNSAYATLIYTAPAVTASVYEKYYLNFDFPQDIQGVTNDASSYFNADNKEVEFKVSEINVAPLRKIEALLESDKVDGYNYYAPAGTEFPLVATAGMSYQRKESSSVSFKSSEADAKAESKIDLSGILPPSAQGFDKIRISTVEENDKATNPTQRYYVQDFHGVIEFGGNNTTLAYVPGFHLQAVDAQGNVVTHPAISNEFGTTNSKMAKGGIVAVSGINNDFYGNDLYEGYEHWTGSEYPEEDEDNLLFTDPLEGYTHANNWAQFARNNNCRMPLFLRYFSVKPKEAAVTKAATGNEPWRTVPNIGGYLTYHYPFLTAESETDAEGGLNVKLRTVNFTAYTPINQKIDESSIMTAIESVEADADWSDAEFFNLQGIRVTDPQPGQVYLMRRGAEVQKVLYR